MSMGHCHTVQHILESTVIHYLRASLFGALCYSIIAMNVAEQVAKENQCCFDFFFHTSTLTKMERPVIEVGCFLWDLQPNSSLS